MPRLSPEPPAWARRYIGLPFRDCGRDRDGLDCYGLVRLVYAERFGVYLPDLAGKYISVDDSSAICESVVHLTRASNEWKEMPLGEERLGDVLLVRLADRWHVGLAIAAGKMLHAWAGSDSAIVDRDDPRWRTRRTTLWRHCGPLQLRGGLAPLVGPTRHDFVPAGVTIAEALTRAHVTPHPQLRVCLGGRPVPPEAWAHIRPRPGSLITYGMVPSGGGGGNKDAIRIIGSLAIIAASIYLPQAGFLAGTALAAGTTGGAVLSAGVAIGGTLALNALIPPAKPRLADLGTLAGASPSITGSRNELRPGAPLPRVAGEYRFAPPLIAQPYTEVAGDDQFIRMLFGMYGPVELRDFKLGDTPLEEFEGVELQVRQGFDDDEPVTLFPSAIIEDSLSVLVDHNGGAWITRRSATNAEELSIDITFPQGLTVIAGDGSRRAATVALDVEFAPAGTSAWKRVNGQSPDIARALDFMFRTPEVIFGGSGVHATRIAWGQAFPDAKPSYLPARRFSWEASGYVKADVAGVYSFGVDSSDACELVINGRVVASWLGTHGTAGGATPDFTAHRGDITLSRGWHQFRFRVEARSTDGAAAVGWKRPGDAAFSIVPATAFAQFLARNRDGPPGLAYRWFNTSNYESSLLVTAASTDALRRSLAWAVTKGQYDVRVRRITADSTDPATLDKAFWSALRSIRTSTKPVNMRNVAVIALRIKATDQVQGEVDQFNCVARSIVPDWDDAAGAWIVRATANPASLYRAAFQMPGAPTRLADARLDLAELQAWHRDNVARGLEYNGVIDTVGTLFERLGEICAAGRASFGMRNGRFSVVRDVPQTTPLQVFTPRNSRDFGWRKSWPRVVHGFRVTWIDASAGYESDTRVVLADGFQLDGKDAFDNDRPDLPPATIFEELQLSGLGVTSWAQAWKTARYYLANAKLRPDVYELTVDWEHLAITRGDLALVAHDAVSIGLAQGRVVRRCLDAGGNVLGLDLDQACVMAAGEEYGIIARLADGRTWARSLQTIPGESPSITFSQFVAVGETAPEPGDLVTYGRLQSETREMIVRSIRMDADLAARIEFVDHAPAVHEADVGTIPPYDPGISRPPDFRDRPDTPIIESIRSDDSVMIRDADGSLRVRMLIGLRRASGTGVAPTHAEVRVRVVAEPGGTPAAWRVIPVQAIDGGTVSVLDVEEGVTYDIRLRTITQAGRTSLWADARHTVVGKLRPPPDLASFGVSRLSDGTRRHVWSYGAPGSFPPDIAGVLIRYGPPGSTWESMVPIHQGVLASSPSELNEPPEGLWRVGAKAVDTGGRESLGMRWVEVTLGPPRMEGVLASEDAALMGWPGTKTDCSVLNGVLEADDPTTWDQLDAAGVLNWDLYTRWNLSPRSPIRYEHTALDVGVVVDLSPDAIVAGDGAVSVELATSIDDVTYSPWTPIADARVMSVRARYVKARVTCGSAGDVVVPVIRRLVVLARAETKVHELRAVSTSSLVGRINGPGDVFLPIPPGYFSLLRSVTVTLRATGPGWTWELVETSVTTGPRIRIYDAAGVGAHATIDAVIRGA